VFHLGDADTLVPPIHMKKLFDLAVNAIHREFFSVLGGTHNDTWEVAGEEYYTVSYIPVCSDSLVVLLFLENETFC
jgi:fermentation-respiration switch protein FrsA (DUF1100 family)